MGTLFEQKPRNTYETTGGKLDGEIKRMKLLAKEHNITFDQVIKTIWVLEVIRRNDIAIANGDIHYEQLAGIREQLIEITNGFHELAEAIMESDFGK